MITIRKAIPRAMRERVDHNQRVLLGPPAVMSRMICTVCGLEGRYHRYRGRYRDTPRDAGACDKLMADVVIVSLQELFVHTRDAAVRDQCKRKLYQLLYGGE